MDYTQRGHKLRFFQKKDGAIPDLPKQIAPPMILNCLASKCFGISQQIRQVCDRGHAMTLRYNHKMIEIRRIQPHEWAIAKRLVYRVAYVIFKETRPLEEMIADFDSRGTLDDLHDIQRNYFDKGGIFLVTTREGEIVGTGAIRNFDGDLCELKRLWLLTDYHGQGLGYRMLQKLLTFARKRGYKRMRLETDAVAQSRAVEFYKRIGFREILIPDATPDEDILMELEL